MDGLRLKDDPENAMRQFVSIIVKPRPGETRPHRAWEVVFVEVVPYSCVPPNMAHEMQSSIQEMQTVFKGKVEGVDVAFYVVIRDIKNEACCMAPISYEKEALEEPGSELTWKEDLIKAVNEGKVFRM